MATVKIYTKTSCPACDLAKQILEEKGVLFEEFILDDKPEELKALINKTNMKTVPQIFINNHLIGGCSDMLDLDRKNQLDILLQAEDN
ncbi:MAG: glutaredoxin 3 [Bdellovibrionaceae bacterium]|nr:glutaredoxin 3 [Pseudobdellovibrionaceae bacterium]